ncbi:hypothetical protein, partial [Megasphaera sp.]
KTTNHYPVPTLFSHVIVSAFNNWVKYKYLVDSTLKKMQIAGLPVTKMARPSQKKHPLGEKHLIKYSLKRKKWPQHSNWPYHHTLKSRLFLRRTV